MVPRNEFNSRIESLLRLVGLEDRLINDGNISIAQDRIDYSLPNKKIVQERKRVDEFLNQLNI